MYAWIVQWQNFWLPTRRLGFESRSVHLKLIKNKMGSIDNQVAFCPLRHPSLDFKKGICFYNLEECKQDNPERCKTYQSIGRTYSLRVQEYQNTHQEQTKKE